MKSKQSVLGSTLLLIACLITASAKAHAEVPCNAPWMHPGGQFVITSSAGNRSYTFDILSFEKQDSDHCSGSLRVTAAYTFQGRDMESKSLFHLTLSNGVADLKPQEDADGTLTGKTGASPLNVAVSQQLSGFFSYAGEIKQAGQTLPATTSHTSVSTNTAANGTSTGQFVAPAMSYSTTERHVGPQESLDTSAGKLDCWPVSYDLTEKSEGITIHGHTLPGSESTLKIVDHYCPATNLVMRKDITSDGKLVTQTVTSIK